MLSAALAVHLTGLGLVAYPPQPGGGGVLPCYIEDMPPTPDAAVCVYTRPGFPRAEPTIDYSTPELQIVVRHPGLDGARSRPGLELADRILSTLDGADSLVWAPSTPDETHVLWCQANSSAPVALGVDETGRPRWSLSVQCEVSTMEVPQ